MADGVAEVQELAAAGFKFVLRHDVALVRNAARNHVLTVKIQSVLRQPVKERAVEEDRRLDDLGAALAEGFLREGVQRGDVAQHQGRLMKRARKVLALRQINGRLASDGGIDHRQKRRRHLHKAQAAQIGRRGKARQIAHHAAAESDDGVRPGQVLVRQQAQELPVVFQIFGLFSRREHRRIYRKSGRLQRCLRALQPERCDIRIRDDQHAARRERGKLRPQRVQQTASDLHIIAAGCLDFYRFHIPSTSSLRSLPASSAVHRAAASPFASASR